MTIGSSHISRMKNTTDKVRKIRKNGEKKRGKTSPLFAVCGPQLSSTFWPETVLAIK